MKQAKITLGVLVILTLISALVSQSEMNYATELVLLLAGLKFIGITYYFMELIKAHVFWRVLIGIFVFIILAITLIIF